MSSTNGGKHGNPGLKPASPELRLPFSRDKKTFYFQNAGKFTGQEMDAIAHLRNSASLSICEFLSSSPGQHVRILQRG
jgi:hypothetical protein